MRESGGKRKEAGELKVSHQKETFINGEYLVTMLVWAFYSQIPFTYYQNNKTSTITMGAIRGDNQNVTKRSQKLKTGNMNSGWRLEQCAGNGQFRNTAKFRKLRNPTGCENFATLQNSYNAPFFFTFCSSFLPGSDLQR